MAEPNETAARGTWSSQMGFILAAFGKAGWEPALWGTKPAGRRR